MPPPLRGTFLLYAGTRASAEESGRRAAEHPQSGKLPPLLPPGWCLARELHLLLRDWPPAGPRLAARWSTMPTLLLCSSADPADSIWAWGGDRGASISNLIPHAWWKEPILSRQRRASCYIDFYINHKGQPGPRRARLWREDKVPPLPSWLAICEYSSAKIPASSCLTISPFRPVGSPFCVQWLRANLQLMDLILSLSRSQSAQAWET